MESVNARMMIVKEFAKIEQHSLFFELNTEETNAEVKTIWWNVARFRLLNHFRIVDV